MRNVVRLEKPAPLTNNAAKWTEELMHQISEKGNFSLVDKKYKKKYSHKDVREQLLKMYNGCCCYCERHVGSSGHIEHLMPMAIYHDKAFDWNNLHIACADCNSAKSDKYNENAPILDPVVDRPIEAHLSYRFNRVKPLTERGKTTRDHADLDRDHLLQARLNIAANIIIIVQEINEDPTNAKFDTSKDELNDLIKGEYGSLIKHHVQRTKQW